MTDYALTGRRVLALTTNYGVEQDELTVPLKKLREGGAEVTVAAAKAEPVQTLVGDKDLGEKVDPTCTLEEANAHGYDLLLLPGGTLNADTLRRNETALDILRSFTTSGRPVAAICHGSWLLVEAGSTVGKTLTSYPSLQTDIRNAGGTWVDQPVVSDDNGGWTLITSRKPGDLDDFLDEISTTLSMTSS
jgi:protease I